MPCLSVLVWRAMSVPCGLVDAAHCADGADDRLDYLPDLTAVPRRCPLRDDDDCPAKIDRERLAVERAAAARAPITRRDRAIAMGLPQRERKELGLESGIGVGFAASAAAFVWRYARTHVTALTVVPSRAGAARTPVRMDA